MNLYSAFCLHSPGLGPTRAARTLASPGFRINASQIRAFLQVAMPTGEREVVMLLRATVLRSVLRKVFDLSAHGITRPLAESILALDFPEEDLH